MGSGLSHTVLAAICPCLAQSTMAIRHSIANIASVLLVENIHQWFYRRIRLSYINATVCLSVERLLYTQNTTHYLETNSNPTPQRHLYGASVVSILGLHNRRYWMCCFQFPGCTFSLVHFLIHGPAYACNRLFECTSIQPPSAILRPTPLPPLSSRCAEVGRPYSMAESLPNVAGYPTDSQLLDNVESSCTLLLPQTPTSYTLQRTHRLNGNGADLDLICPPAFLDDAAELLEHANTHCAEDSIHDSEDFPSLQQTHAESTSESICDKAYPSVVTPLGKLEGTVFSDFRMIGRGGFGRVVLAQRLQQVGEESVQDYVAIKVVRKRAPFRSPDWRQKLLTEKEIMQRVTLQTCPSPFLMNLLSSWADESNVYFVMKYCPMSLDDRLQDLRAAGRCMGVQEAKLCCAELILGLSHLHHEVKIIHRDIKPQNILINRDGTYLYADFGLAFDPKKRNLCASSVYKAAGTDGYSAPEVCDPKVHIFGYGHKADVFSLGLVLAEVFGADTPLYQHCSKWTAQDKLNKATGVIFDQWEWMRREPVLDKLANLQIDPLAKGLLEKMLQTRCSQRASAKDLMKDPYFHDVDWGRVLNSQYRHPFKPVMPTLDRYLKTNLAFRSSLGDICSINYPSHEELKINSVDDAHTSSGSEEGNDDCDFLFDYSQGDNFTSPTVDAMHEIYEIPFNAA